MDSSRSVHKLTYFTQDKVNHDVEDAYIGIVHRLLRPLWHFENIENPSWGPYTDSAVLVHKSYDVRVHISEKHVEDDLFGAYSKKMTPYYDIDVFENGKQVEHARLIPELENALVNAERLLIYHIVQTTIWPQPCRDLIDSLSYNIAVSINNAKSQAGIRAAVTHLKIDLLSLKCKANETDQLYPDRELAGGYVATFRHGPGEGAGQSRTTSGLLNLGRTREAAALVHKTVSESDLSQFLIGCVKNAVEMLSTGAITNSQFLPPEQTRPARPKELYSVDIGGWYNNSDILTIIFRVYRFKSKKRI